MPGREIFIAEWIGMRGSLLFLLGISLFLANGCAGVSAGVGNRVPETGTPNAAFDDDSPAASQLTAALVRLAGTVDLNEARKLAGTAVGHSLHLAAAYRIVRPAVFHNMLVNAGIRERGLCIHWTRDLMKELLALDLKTIQIRWGIACPKGVWGLEHSSAVACAVGTGFQDGIVLDPWRDSGRLFWIRVPADSYAWRELPLDTGESIEKRYPCGSDDG